MLAIGIMASGGAAASVVLDEGFEAVTGIASNTSVRTVADILLNSPGQLQGSPVTSFANTGNGNASAAAFNVRRADNAIDGTSGSPTLGNVNFDNFFIGNSNKFLVIGDDTGNLDNNPNGGTNTNASSTMSIQFDLGASSFVKAVWLDISFDYVFDANDAANPDDFVAELILADSSTFSLLNFAAPTSTTTRGTLFALIALDDLAAAPRYLNFRLKEYTGNGSSAVGLDNLLVNSIPEPGVLVLVGAGLIGLLRLRRRAA
jgi:hypothetical protein